MPAIVRTGAFLELGASFALATLGRASLGPACVLLHAHDCTRTAIKYADGTDIQPGDEVLIGGRYRGRVLACMDSGTCLPGFDDWQYLCEGILVDTEFGGLVHYTETTSEDIARRSEHLPRVSQAP